jgi:hypothetical protein
VAGAQALWAALALGLLPVAILLGRRIAAKLKLNSWNLLAGAATRQKASVQLRFSLIVLAEKKPMVPLASWRPIQSEMVRRKEPPSRRTALGQSRLLPDVGRSAASPRAADIKPIR